MGVYGGSWLPSISFSPQQRLFIGENRQILEKLASIWRHCEAESPKHFGNRERCSHLQAPKVASSRLIVASQS